MKPKSVREEVEKLQVKEQENTNEQEQEQVQEQIQEVSVEIDRFAPKTESDFERLDMLDEKQIVDELKGRLMDKYFYEFEQWDSDIGRKRTVVGISYAGTKAIALLKGNIETVDIHAEVTENEYVCHVVIKDTARNISLPGGASQSKMMRLKDGSLVPDRFAYAKVISKATRNALRSLIPEELIKELYVEYKEQRRHA